MIASFSRLLACLLALAFTLALAKGLAAQTLDLEVVANRSSDEKPLTQRDLDVFFNFMKFNEDRRNDGVRGKNADALGEEFMKKNKVTEDRLKFVLERVVLVLAVVENGDDVIDPDDEPKVTSGEKRLIKSNRAKLINALQKAQH
jgi:hypothetical protein